MGLDCYLSVRKSVYPKKGTRVLDLDNLPHGMDGYESDKFGVSNNIGLEIGVAYWRKANQIHHWFVENCQDGRDECQDSYVSAEKLHELYDICKGILHKVNGKKFSIDKKTQEYWDKENEKAKAEGKKIPYNYAKTFVFDENKIEDFYDDIWSYSFEDKNGAIADYCKEVLPPSEGFFFGSYTIDGGYIFDIIKTVLMFDRLFKNLAEWEEKGEWVDVVYRASW